MKTKVNEIQISYHGNQTINTTFKIGCSQDAAQLAFEHWDQNHIEMQEHFKILLLNNSNIVKGIYEVSKGGRIYICTSTNCKPVCNKIYFKTKTLI